MTLEISHRLHVPDGGALARDVALPAMRGREVSRYDPPLLDQVGEAVQRAWPVVTAAGATGGLVGALLLRGGPTVLGQLRGAFGGALGLALGAGTAAAGATLLRRDERPHAATQPAHDAREPSITVTERERVKVMSWNLHGGMGGPEEFFASDSDLDRLAAAVRRERPDVLLVQESDRFAARSTFRDTLEELDERLDADSAVTASPKTTVLGRDQGVGVLTFNGFRVADARNVVHPDPRGGNFDIRLRSFARDAKAAVGKLVGQDFPTSGTDAYQVRNTIDTVVTTPAGTDLRVLSGHYEGPNELFDHQRGQVGALARQVGTWDGPTLWGGDFNVDSHGARGALERRLMRGAGLHDAWYGAGVSPRGREQRATSSTGRAIDRIYHSRHAEVRNVHTVAAGWASDHKALVADLELVPDP